MGAEGWGPKFGGFKGGGPNQQKDGGPQGGGLKCGARRVGARTVEGPKFRAFFFPLFGSFSLSLGFSRGIVAAVQGHGPPMVPVCASLGSFCARLHISVPS